MHITTASLTKQNFPLNCEFPCKSTTFKQNYSFALTNSVILSKYLTHQSMPDVYKLFQVYYLLPIKSACIKERTTSLIQILVSASSCSTAPITCKLDTHRTKNSKIIRDILLAMSLLPLSLALFSKLA